jgi:tetratricopeptide (TPR) repeat protein
MEGAMTSDVVKRLATAVSLAARIEPELLRAARLRLFPDMDVSAEGDLWFSDLVASRSARRIVLDRGIVSSLRQSLASDPTLLNAARAVVAETHRNAPPAIQLEEEIVYLALTGADVEDTINTKLTSVLNAIANEGRRGLIDWAARALPGMPSIVQNMPAAAALRLVAGGEIGDALHVSRDPAMAALVGRAVPKTKVFARLVPHHDGLSVEISRTGLPASHEIELPKTEPLVLELTTGGHTEIVDVPHEGTLRRETDGALSIRTIAREVFRLEESRDKERTTVRILVMTGLGNAELPDEPDVDVVLIAGNVVEPSDDKAYAYALVADQLQGRFKTTPVFAVPGPYDDIVSRVAVPDQFQGFRGRLGLTSDQIDFARSVDVNGIRIGVVGINTWYGEFEAAQIVNTCGGDPLGWARAHHAAILVTYSAPEHLHDEARERWSAFGTGDVFDFIATGSANTPELPEGYVVVEFPDPDGGALVSIHRHGHQREIRRQAIHPRMDAMPPAPPRRVLVAGIAEGLPIVLQELCRAIGSLLALQGHDLLTGGWPGVDHLVAKGFDEAAPHRIESLSHYLGGPRKESDYKRGRPVFFDQEEDALSEAVSNADVVILVDGAEGTRSVGVEAISRGKPVIPIGGGAAAELRDIATRPGRWADAAAGLLRRLTRVPVGRSQDFVESLPDTLPEQANIATIAHDVNELLRLARPLEPDLLERAFRLRALGRLTEALELMRAGLEMRIRQEDWKQAAISASNLSELELTLGEVAGAVADAGESVIYADRNGDAFERMGTRTTHADALHQAGRRDEAEARFREAEQMQAQRQPAYPLPYSLQGFRYCDLLLSAVERDAGKTEGDRNKDEGLALCRSVAERAAQTLKWATEAKLGLLDIALDHLTLGRAALYAAILESRSRQREMVQPSPPPTSDESQRGFTSAATELDHAVSGLRRAGQQDYLPRGLLTRAWLRSLTAARTGPESAQSDLDEAWEIAERGPMPLFLTDIHLYRARLFFREAMYPWQSPQHDLAEARRLIFKHGYLRRKEELEDAEAALKSADASAR